METDRINIYIYHENFDEVNPVEKKLLHLKKLGENIMSAISDFAAKQNEYNDKIDGSINGLQDDVKSLKDLIDKIQNSPGAISPEDQASLDALQARSQSISDKLSALDSLTPPPPPVA